MKPLSDLRGGHSGSVAFVMPKTLPLCHACGEHGIHGTAAECVAQLRKAIAVCQGQVVATVQVPVMPVVRKVAEGVSGW